MSSRRRPSRRRVVISLIGVLAVTAVVTTAIVTADGSAPASAEAAGGSARNSGAATTTTTTSTGATSTGATPTGAGSTETAPSGTATSSRAISASPTSTTGASASAGATRPAATTTSPSAGSVESPDSGGGVASSKAAAAVSAVDKAELTAALTSARAYATSRGETSTIAVLDRDTGTTYSVGDTTRQYQSASVVKVFIAAELILNGKIKDAGVEATAYEMITESNDNDADDLYGLVGGDELTDEIEKQYDLTGLAPPPVAGSWGSTYITAAAMIKFYQEVADQPAVSSWLLDAMAHTQQTAADGTDQYFGIPSATSGWKIKQGWVCCEVGVSGVNSTGYVDDDRFVVVMLTEGTPSQYLTYEQNTIDTMARRIFSGNTVVGA